MSLLFKNGSQIPRKPAPKLLEHPSVLPSKPATTKTASDDLDPLPSFPPTPENTEAINSVKDVPLTLIFKMKEMFSARTKQTIESNMEGVKTIHDIFNLTNNQNWLENAGQHYNLSQDDAMLLRSDVERVYKHLSSLIL